MLLKIKSRKHEVLKAKCLRAAFGTNQARLVIEDEGGGGDWNGGLKVPSPLSRQDFARLIGFVDACRCPDSSAMFSLTAPKFNAGLYDSIYFTSEG